MTAAQRKLGCLVVIEVHRLPLVCIVAGLAFGAVSCAVGILQPVARDAGRGEVLVKLAGVAGRAGNGLVCAHQRKRGLAVVERLDAAPSVLAVASIALLAETALVGIDRLVTVEAASRCISELHRLHMTAVATRRLVGTLEIEIREGVIECFPVELNDVRTPPLVIRVAVLAIPFRRIGLTPVETLSQPTIGGDLLVARKTKTRLRLAENGS